MRAERDIAESIICAPIIYQAVLLSQGDGEPVIANKRN